MRGRQSTFRVYNMPGDGCIPGYTAGVVVTAAGAEAYLVPDCGSTWVEFSPMTRWRYARYLLQDGLHRFVTLPYRKLRAHLDARQEAP